MTTYQDFRQELERYAMLDRQARKQEPETMEKLREAVKPHLRSLVLDAYEKQKAATEAHRELGKAWSLIQRADNQDLLGTGIAHSGLRNASLARDAESWYRVLRSYGFID